MVLVSSFLQVYIYMLHMPILKYLERNQQGYHSKFVTFKSLTLVARLRTALA